MKPQPKTPKPVQLELFTVEPRPVKPAAWPTPRGSCSRLRAAVVREFHSQHVGSRDTSLGSPAVVSGAG